MPLAVILLCVLPGCGRRPSTSAASLSTDKLTLMNKSASITVWATAVDRQAAKDVFAALQVNSEQICAALQTACEFHTTVEIYPDQPSFDEHAMDPDMRGFFAISGNGRIQMVSPANPGATKISYKDGTLVAAHEYTHLALDEVNPEMPLWLDEGAAIYIGPHNIYTTVCRYLFPFEKIPSFRQLADHYNEVSAPDLFAYSAVDFIVHEYGLGKLNELLRSPDGFEEDPGTSEAEFEYNWHEYMRAQYHNYTASIIPVLGTGCIFVLGAVIMISVARRRRS